MDAAARRAARLFDRAKREARSGLVHGTYFSPHYGTFSIADGASAAVLHQRQRAFPRYDRSKRGKVTEFSRQSQRRFMQFHASIPKQRVASGGLFVTLTYPSAWSGDWQRWKRDLTTMGKRVLRKFPHASATWKLEPQKRGAPHYHLVMTGVQFIAKDWLARSWYEVVGSGDQRHLRAGTQVQAIRTTRAVVAYAAKYVEKGLQLPPDWSGGVGRWWGVWNRADFGIQWTWWGLTPLEFDAVKSALESRLRGRRGLDSAADEVYTGGLWLIMDAEDAVAIASSVGLTAPNR